MSVAESHTGGALGDAARRQLRRPRRTRDLTFTIRDFIAHIDQLQASYFTPAERTALCGLFDELMALGSLADEPE